MRNKVSKIFVITGAVLIFSALLLFGYNKFEDYKAKKVQSGENRKLSHRFYFPHEDATDVVIYKEDNDAEISRTLCTGLLVGAIIDAYERFEESTPSFSHEYKKLWFEG